MKGYRRWGFRVAGILLVLSGIVWTLRVPYFYLRSKVVSTQLLHQATDVVTSTPIGSLSPSGTNTGTAQGKGTGHLASALIGVIEIPTLHLTAPIVQGTGNSQLDVAVGHLTTSVFPGVKGTSVLAAHNATWFRHVNRLHPGDSFVIHTDASVDTFKVVKSVIVRTGSPIYNSVQPTLVLESCYPLNALYLTPYRYLVYAQLVSARAKTENLSLLANSNVNFTNTYKVNLPPTIPLQETNLDSNSLPMGTLRYSGQPADSFVQSNQPLSASDALVRLYLAWVHASATQDELALKFLPQVRNNPILGVNLSSLHYISAYNVVLDVNGNQLGKLSASVQIQVQGRVYNVQLVARNINGNIKLSSIQVS